MPLLVVLPARKFLGFTGRWELLDAMASQRYRWLQLRYLSTIAQVTSWMGITWKLYTVEERFSRSMIDPYSDNIHVSTSQLNWPSQPQAFRSEDDRHEYNGEGDRVQGGHDVRRLLQRLHAHPQQDRRCVPLPPTSLL